MDLRKMRWDGVDWINLAQNRDKWRAVSCEHVNEPWGSMKENFLTS
jgi:hypothetical protein